MAGPGYRGDRQRLPAAERAKIAEGLRQAGIDVPAYLEGGSHWVDRKAKLFEAGEYPDKGVTVAPEDLQRLAGGFDMPVPVLIEHADSPLEIGYLTDVEASGNELFGTIALTEEADRLVEKSGARSLSLGLSPDLLQIREVSLVRNPRVESAQLFSGTVCFAGSLCELPGTDWRARHEALRSEVDRERAEREVGAFVKAGKLTPAQAPFAQALMSAGDTIEFGGEVRPIRQLLIAMLERQPPMGLFSETVPDISVGSEGGLLPEEAEFYRRHFPDVSLEEIAVRK